MLKFNGQPNHCQFIKENGNVDDMGKEYTSSCVYYQGVFFGCFSRFLFTSWSCLIFFCFRTLSLSFLPLSPIVFLLFRLSPSSPLKRHNCNDQRNLKIHDIYPCFFIHSAISSQRCVVPCLVAATYRHSHRTLLLKKVTPIKQPMSHL
jgi:hypothetical protein